MEYLLTGKLFCGICGSRMTGENGRSKNKNVYSYYTCASRKKDHNCAKKNERKDFFEWCLVEQTVEYVLDSSRMEYMAERLVAQYEKGLGGSRIKELEHLMPQKTTWNLTLHGCASLPMFGIRRNRLLHG